MPREPSFDFPPFRLDPANESLWRGEEALVLRPKTFAVLRYLVERAGQLVSKDELLTAVWPDSIVSEGVIKGCIREIRSVLNDPATEPQLLATIHRRGYRFIGTIIRSQHSVDSSQEKARDWRRETSPPSAQASSL